MIYDPDPDRCQDPHVRNQFVAVYCIYGAFYAILFLLDLITLRKALKYNVKFSTDMKISRYFILFMLIFKSIVQFLTVVDKFNPVKNFGFFLTTFPGYIVDISFCLLLMTWCNLFLSFCSSKLYCILKTIRLTSLITIPISILVYIVCFIVTTSASTETKNTARNVENYFALCFDFIISVVFVIFLFILICSLEVKFSCSDFSNDQIVLWLCLLSVIGLLMRTAMRIVFQVQMEKYSNPMAVVCSMPQFISYILRETFGQIIPFSFMMFADYFLQGPDISMSLDQTDLLNPST